MTDRDWAAEAWDAMQPDTVSDANAGETAAPPPPVEPTTIVVIGSADWVLPSVVGAVLHEWWEGAGNPPVQLVTSGCPTGAEAAARELYQHWHLVTVRDEGLVELQNVLVFAFIRDRSPGATAALKLLRRRGPWERVIRDDTRRNVSPWISR